MVFFCVSTVTASVSGSLARRGLTRTITRHFPSIVIVACVGSPAPPRSPSGPGEALLCFPRDPSGKAPLPLALARARATKPVGRLSLSTSNYIFKIPHLSQSGKIELLKEL